MSVNEIGDLLSEHTDRAGRFSAVLELPLAGLRAADSPRTGRTNDGYVRMLAASTEPFPPIVVHRESMCVIDGNQRVEATRLRGENSITAVLFDGDEKLAFVLAVRLNVTHGLPLTIAERKAAAFRLLREHPDHSDRSIAAVSGISDKTVAAIRRSSGIGELPDVVRIGRQGAAHRTLNAPGRQRAAQLLTENPHAPLKEVATAAGISLTTAKDVRSRLRRGEAPVPAGRVSKRGSAGDSSVPDTVDCEAVMQRLSHDPALRFSESGRNLLRWLALSRVDQATVDQIVAGLPGHCRTTIAELARQRSDDWRRFAVLLAESTAAPRCLELA